MKEPKKTEYEEWIDNERAEAERIKRYQLRARARNKKPKINPEESQAKRNTRRSQAKAANCLQDILIELLDERKIQLSQIQKEADLSWATLWGWYSGSTKTPMLDMNILKLARFLNVSIEYLCYGIGDDGPRYED